MCYFKKHKNDKTNKFYYFKNWINRINKSSFCYPPLYLKKNEVSLTIFYNTILLRAKRACVFYPWSFFNVFCEFNRNVSFVCCGKIVKNKFLVKFLSNNPEILEENYVLFGEIGFWWAVVIFKQRGNGERSESLHRWVEKLIGSLWRRDLKK